MEENTIEYLEEIRNINKKRLFWTRISVVLVAVFVVIVAMVASVLISTLNTANETMVNANQAINQAEEIMSDLSVAIEDMEEAVNAINSLVDDSSESLVEAFNNINSIDFEGLNDAITDLGNVVEPMSKFFSVFNKK